MTNYMSVASHATPSLALSNVHEHHITVRFVKHQNLCSVLPPNITYVVCFHYATRRSKCCRQTEGRAPEGYTLQEACTLTRSSLTKQRVLALHLLSAVLAAARPQASHHDTLEGLQPQPVHLPSLLTQAEGNPVSALIL